MNAQKQRNNDFFKILISGFRIKFKRKKLKKKTRIRICIYSNGAKYKIFFLRIK